MKRNVKTIGGFIIASAIIWGAVIVGCSLVLKGTECYGKIQNILVGGVLSHLILLWGPLALMFARAGKDQPENPEKNR